ncbi:MAG: RsmD family RNA methyltransferase [Candidatus Aminicenantes bacterium]|nr:RsmD family RNA methyltransferase [Candidatus Aminicenantes bacterium]
MAEPLCPYFRQCGGCLYQHLDYQDQLKRKANELSLATGSQDIEIFSGEPYYYRTRMDFIFHHQGLGLRERHRWWRIVNIDKCVIATQSLNHLAKQIRDYFQEIDAFDVKSKIGTFRFAVIRTPPTDSSISFVLNKEAGNLPIALDQITHFAQITSAKNVVVTFVPPNRDVSISDDFQVIRGKPFLEEEIQGKKFLYPVQGFFQTNHEMTEKLHQYCRSILEKYAGRRTYLLDLYAGVGTFGLLNADLFRQVYLLENYEPAIQAANENITNLGLKNVSPILEDAQNIHRITFPSPLIVVVDPPRSGLHPKVLKHLNHLRPRALLYISCNVQRLRHDLAALSDYRIQKVALFDFFPQTPHLEAVVEFRLKY